jgi:hypothetical protein
MMPFSGSVKAWRISFDDTVKLRGCLPPITPFDFHFRTWSRGTPSRSFDDFRSRLADQHP